MDAVQGFEHRAREEIVGEYTGRLLLIAIVSTYSDIIFQRSPNLRNPGS